MSNYRYFFTMIYFLEYLGSDKSFRTRISYIVKFMFLNYHYLRILNSNVSMLILILSIHLIHLTI